MGRWLLLKAMYIPPSCPHHTTPSIPLKSRLRLRYAVGWKMHEHHEQSDRPHLDPHTFPIIISDLEAEIRSNHPLWLTAVSAVAKLQ